MQDELRNYFKTGIAKVVKKSRTKSITKSSDEIGMHKAIWADLEKGNKDPQLSTLWRIAEGLDLKPHTLVKMIEEELGENFSFLENTFRK